MATHMFKMNKEHGLDTPTLSPFEISSRRSFISWMITIIFLYLYNAYIRLEDVDFASLYLQPTLNCEIAFRLGILASYVAASGICLGAAVRALRSLRRTPCETCGRKGLWVVHCLKVQERSEKANQEKAGQEV
ncbi:hypothetical protein BDQ17DRAFT_1360396 [Cyathus striatus]|nr:hypothetical protein BDQ17DRAFT_1360396 [Cyathus striatus]